MYKNPQIEAVFIAMSDAADAARRSFDFALDDSLRAVLDAMATADVGISHNLVVDWEVAYGTSLLHQEAMRDLHNAFVTYQKAVELAFLAATGEHQRAFLAAYDADAARRDEAAVK
jgi:hypothetical protein